MADSDNIRSWDAGRVAYGATDLFDPDNLWSPLNFADLENIPAGFDEVGYHDPDQGFAKGRTGTRTDHYGRGPTGTVLVRTTYRRELHQTTFTALETNLAVQTLRYPGATVVPTGGVTVTTIGAPVPQRYCWIFDSIDGEIRKRTIYPSGEVVEWGESTENGDNPEIVPLTVVAYAFDTVGNTVVEITDDPALAVAS